MCATPARHRARFQGEEETMQGFWSARSLVDPSRGGGAARHVRKTSSTYVLHIGRVGALAVSLGVGFAVANSAGVAYADSDADTSSSVSSDSQGGGAPADQQSEDAESAATEDGDPDEGDPADDESSIDDAEDLAEQELDAEQDFDAEQEPDDDVALDDTTDEDADEPDSDPEASSPPPAVDDSEGGGAATPETDDEGPSAESPVVEPADAEPDSDVPVDDLLDEVSGPAEATEADDDPQTDVVALKSVNQESADELVDSATEAEESVETVNVVSALVSNVVSPFADPEAPAPAPWLDAVLAWVRRQIEHTFFNKSPVFGPIESSQILTGQVLFDLNESDPNGDPLTYTIIQPEHGLVVRELITGKFVYTPTSIVAGDPLTDSFQVVISDSS
ncbi:MAG: hypothetical protein KAH46_25330, partial [Mycobacterium sp.]|nr:hypothetical protein [Mycobacterium sp.]